MSVRTCNGRGSKPRCNTCWSHAQCRAQGHPEALPTPESFGVPPPKVLVQAASSPAAKPAVDQAFVLFCADLEVQAFVRLRSESLDGERYNRVMRIAYERDEHGWAARARGLASRVAAVRT